MAHFRVFDQETATLLKPRVDSTVDVLETGEYFSADVGEVILAPSIKAGDVLYIRIKSAAPAGAESSPPESLEPTEGPAGLADPAKVGPEPTAAALNPETKTRHYVASGFLGLDGDVEEEIPEAAKPWWKRLFID